ncbi:MAG: hypothetical protein NC418_06600 [Muribaculaceae bacterium]|nr:hypothetical protein [Muribaculaceae bacterium]
MSINDSEILAHLADTELDTSGAIFRAQIFTIDELCHKIDSGKLCFVDGKPFRQWTLKHRIRAVEGLLMGLPPASIVIDGSSATWYVIDGAESLRTYIEFCRDEFRLEHSVLFLKSDTEPCFSELPARFRRRFLNSEISASILSPDCSYGDRLWAYWSALSREVLTRGTLWDCLGSIDGKLVYALHRLADGIGGIDDPHTLWLILLGLTLSDKIDNPGRAFSDKAVDKFIERAPFDIFECVALRSVSRMDKLDDPLPSLISKFCQLVQAANLKRTEERLLCLVLGWSIGNLSSIDSEFINNVLEKLQHTHRLIGDSMLSYIKAANRTITSVR